LREVAPPGQLNRWVALLSVCMNLEIKAIAFDEALDQQSGIVPIRVDIGERDKPGAESFNFTVASPAALAHEVTTGDFKLLRGYILMSDFDVNVVRRSIENLINHARSRETWNEVIAFFNRYGVYDSEDLDETHFP
jgi:Immunity protein 8